MTTTPTKFEQTHIAMVLDRSQSMGSCRDSTIEAVNPCSANERSRAIVASKWAKVVAGAGSV